MQTSDKSRFGSIQDICTPIGARPRPPEIDHHRLSVVDTISQEEDFDVLKGVFRAIPGLPYYVVTMKTLHMSAIPVCRSYLLQEAALLTGLNHPHVVRLIGVVTVAKPNSLVLEYCEYGELDKFVSNHKLSRPEQYKMSGDVANGMAYLHSHHIVHRNLSASNVMIDSCKTCKISLTGLSRHMFGRSSGVFQRDYVPVNWCAPECLTKYLFSEQSDVWAFGVVMYEIFTHGYVPFADMLNKQVRELLVRGAKPPLPYHCPEKLAAILLMCWRDYGIRPKFISLSRIVQEAEASALDASIEQEQQIDIQRARLAEV